MVSWDQTGVEGGVRALAWGIWQWWFSSKELWVCVMGFVATSAINAPITLIPLWDMTVSLNRSARVSGSVSWV